MKELNCINHNHVKVACIFNKYPNRLDWYSMDMVIEAHYQEKNRFKIGCWGVSSEKNTKRRRIQRKIVRNIANGPINTALVQE